MRGCGVVGSNVAVSKLNAAELGLKTKLNAAELNAAELGLSRRQRQPASAVAVALSAASGAVGSEASRTFKLL